MNTDFKNKVKIFVKLDEEIKRLHEKIKKYRTKKNIMMTYILKHMNQNGIEDIKINTDVKLKIKQTTQYSAISKTYLQKILLKKLKKPTVATQIVNLIYNNRTKKINNSVEISLNKRTKKM
tara:strand:- start:3654 stop:4016 length:363 start_codon:yes stop_codon:yes gene_type:complete